MFVKSLAIIEFDSECAIHRSARRVVAQMVGTHSTVNIIEDVVYAQVNLVAQHTVLSANIMGGVDAP